jgi:RND family efflux transporter MFP subunit
VVAKRLVNGGERVMADAPLLQLVDLSRLELEATVPAGEVSKVTVGQAVRFVVDGFGEQSFEGKVARISPVTEAGSRAIKLFVSVLNPTGVLRGGMFAQGRVNLSDAKVTSVVPNSAVFEEAGQTYVFAIVTGKLVKQAVTLGLKDDVNGVVEVTKGLSAGQQLVRVRMGGLKTGQSVVMASVPAKAASQPA